MRLSDRKALALTTLVLTIASVTALSLHTLPAGERQVQKPAVESSDSKKVNSARQDAGRATTPPGKNRLALESSPYLLMHADNPVDWYPWGEAAFEKARREDKPIFLSVGYSTCYWCHVFERESFSNPETAEILNLHFVSIKVDREERPDVDDIYMTSLYLMGGRGGWPLSVFLTPELKPFYGGTYFPEQPFRDLLRQLAGVWETRRNDVELVAQNVVDGLQRINSVAAGNDTPLPENELMKRAVSLLSSSYDEVNGGFSAAPKFPQPANLQMLLDFHERTGDDDVLAMVTHTLRQMARGGIHDQVGGGFHRYSTDPSWTVPHFEKMLYDQAQLLKVYARAHALTGDRIFRRVAEDIAAYVDSEMTASSGLFYSARDSEVGHEEGASYVWTRAQVKQVLNEDDYRLAAQVYGLDGEPHFDGGRYVLRWSEPYAQTASKLGMGLNEIFTRMDSVDAKLLAARERRSQPLLDDKSVTAWNGLMIDGLAYAGMVLERPDYIRRAARAADALLTQMRDRQGNFLHVARHGQAKLHAYLGDYGATILGLMQLDKATGDGRWRAEAANLADAMIANLWDGTGGAFFQARPQTENLLVQTKSSFDGAIPSGNSLAVAALIALAETDLDRYAGYAADTLRAYASQLNSHPGALTEMVRGAVAYRSASMPLNAQVEPRSGRLPSTADLVTVSPRLTRAQDGRLRLLTTLAMEDGWHVNANPASLDFLIPTQIAARANGQPVELAVAYPKGREMDGGLGEPIRVYGDTVTISASVDESQDPEDLEVTVRAQACNDEGRCLPPADIHAAVPAEPAHC